jgi:hypothetical protein
MSATKKKRGTSDRFTTPRFRISYPSVFEKKVFEDSKDKEGCYRFTMVFKKDNPEAMAPINDAVTAAKRAHFTGPDGKVKIPKNFRDPVRDGDDDEEFPTNEEYRGCWIVTAKSRLKRKPDVCYNYKDPETGKWARIDPDSEDFFSGCWCKASVTAYGYDHGKENGVAFSFNNVMLLRKGTPFGGAGTRAEDDFSEEDVAEMDDFDEDDESFGEPPPF